MDGRSLYEADFALWAQTQAEAIRAAAATGANLPLDWANLAEEIEDLGKSRRSDLESRLATIVEHLLKLRLSTALDPRRGWIETVKRSRLDVEDVLAENPSLKSTLADSLTTANRRGRQLARISLERHEKVSSETRRALDGATLDAAEVLGPGLPDDEPA